jgi:hypothetical protein
MFARHADGDIRNERRGLGRITETRGIGILPEDCSTLKGSHRFGVWFPWADAHGYSRNVPSGLGGGAQLPFVTQTTNHIQPQGVLWSNVMET